MNLKDFKPTINNMELCHVCNNYVQTYKMHNYILKGTTTPVMRMCFKCLNREVRATKY